MELLADAYAATIEATAKVAIINMLDAMILSKVSVDSVVISGRKRPSSVVSMREATKTGPMDNTQTISGLIHNPLTEMLDDETEEIPHLQLSWNISRCGTENSASSIPTRIPHPLRSTPT